MATFTKIEDGQMPSIEVSASRIVSNINPLIYGGFTEHMGRCIYGGLYDPENKHNLIDKNGFRTDVIDALKDLNVPAVRYPGGNFVASYHWLDGVGPREKRPVRPELAWVTEESNQFGTDEFMKWCRIIGAEPFLALNFGTGTLDEALGWLEYCNSDKNTYYADLRRKNGNEKPYGVKYWALGNEMWGKWQVGQLSKEDYAKKALQWGKALKLLDPSIKLILCGETGYSDWDRYVLQECIQYIDMHSIHIYTNDEEHLANVTAPRSAERAIEMAASLIDLARIATGHTAHRPTICFDEWNVWDEGIAPGHLGGEQVYDLSDALGLAAWCNVFIRQARWLGMCNIAQSVNVLSPILTTERGLVKQTLYWPLFLFSKYMRGKTLAVHVRSGAYEGRTRPEWIASTCDTPWLDVSAALGDDGFVNLAVVNISEEKALETDLKGVEGSVQVFNVGGESAGVRVANTEGVQKVGIVESRWNGKGSYTFPAHSFTLLRWKAVDGSLSCNGHAG